MTILTGVVLTIALGAVVQSGDLMGRFGAGPGIHPRDDVVELAANDVYAIDVVANDRGAVDGDGRRVLIMTAPACGVAYRSGDRMIYQGAAECAGVQRLTYCVARGDECLGAEVTLVLSPSSVAASPTDTPVARLAERPARPSDAEVSMAPGGGSGFTVELGTAAGERPLVGLSTAFGSLAPGEAAAEAGASAEGPAREGTALD
ncbi:hypothetical protein [uncultured Albimonas sp.]|uniref:hypothetical protein n=1 Tax=uncultured Albimonas sp. TaxID=1331701 RepID=UPI0030ECA2E8|tara:strand:- start:4289 stop:4900 length:612 start_codon:yes stop_codon:yes gene_type:complete